MPQSMGSQRVGHNLVTEELHPTPVQLCPGGVIVTESKLILLTELTGQ